MGELQGMLERIHLFSDLDNDDREIISKSTRCVQLPKGKTLFQRGDRADGFYFVVQGRVKLFVISPAGSEKVIELVRDGMTFGEAAMFIDKPYPVTAQAVGDSKLLFIGREAILLSLEKQRDFALKMLMGISRRLHGLVHDIETYSLCSSVQRVVGYLLSEVENQSVGAVNDSLQLPASKVVVASRLNLTPETLSRAFSELTQKGLIAVSGSKIQICEMDKFRAYCHGVNVA